jgi:hypothetical protein
MLFTHVLRRSEALRSSPNFNLVRILLLVEEDQKRYMKKNMMFQIQIDGRENGMKSPSGCQNSRNYRLHCFRSRKG